MKCILKSSTTMREKKLYKLNYVKHKDGFYYLLKPKVKYSKEQTHIEPNDIVFSNNPNYASRNMFEIKDIDLYVHMDLGDKIKVLFEWEFKSYSMIPLGWHKFINEYPDEDYIHYESDELGKKQWKFLCMLAGVPHKKTTTVRIKYNSIETFVE